jgi:excisionase family DNA binding protein
MKTVSFTPSEGLWTVRDLADHLKASRSWVYARAESGELPCIRLGGLLRFNPAAIRKWVEQQQGASVVALRQS